MTRINKVGFTAFLVLSCRRTDGQTDRQTKQSRKSRALYFKTILIAKERKTIDSLDTGGKQTGRVKKTAMWSKIDKDTEAGREKKERKETH